MAFNDDQNEYPVPTNGSNRKSSDLLPRYFRTSANKKFLGSTLDQFTTPGVVEKINAFVGSREAKAVSIDDNYLADINNKREAYQLSPGIVIKDNIDNVTFYKDYNDYIGLVESFNGTVSNHSLLNSQEFYAWNPHIDFDKFVNFREYYWLPNGPQEVPVRGQSRDVVSTYTITTVEDDDNVAFLFNENTVRNPKIKLYRGQTYRFEIDTPGHPISIATNRAYKPGYAPPDESVTSTLYDDGVTITFDDTDTLVNRSDYIEDGYVEKGVLEFTVPDNAPDTLYYISQYNINTSGIFQIYDIEENSVIDIEAEILGKKTYTTIDGWDFSNGMKVYFIGNVIPESYSNGLYYVDGVGSSIALIPVNDLQVPAIFTQDTVVPFDIYGFDRVPYGDALSYAGSKDYVVMSKTDGGKNAWARYNRWFHRDVIQKSAQINAQTGTRQALNQGLFELDEGARAKRPIIEFESGLRLYNHGTRTKQYVDLVDVFTPDVFSTIEGSAGYNVDGIDLVEGMRVLFTGDQDSFVNGKIFEVTFITHNNSTQISLIETEDTDPQLDETVLVRTGNVYAGRMFWYNGTEWKLAQDKTGLNQAPKFDLYDENGVSLGDVDVYPTTDFRGNRVFSYRVGEGSNDTELGFPLTYKNIENIGDIVFDFDLLSDQYSYEENNVVKTINSDVCYLKKYNTSGNIFVYQNAWSKANIKSRQFVVRKYTGKERVNKFAIDVYNNSGLLTDLEVRVYVNNDLKIQGTDYNFVIENNVKKINFVNNLNTTDILVIKTHSKTAKNANGYYEIPSNLERNPLNNNITEFTLGQVNDHVDSLVSEIAAFTGEQPGRNNLRDLGEVYKYGRKFVQHSGSIALPLYHLATKNSNIIRSIRFARNEYGKFKRSFLQLAHDTSFDGTIKDFVDHVLQEYAKDKNANMPFYSSDMLGIGGTNKLTYTVLDYRNQYYALSTPFSLDLLGKKAVYVYVNGEQLTYEKDYVFTNEGFVQITTTLSNGDVVDIYEYETTEGSYIPQTPTKLGLYPAFEPEKYTDTTYAEPIDVIRGHDGSIFIAFGDYRDELLLDLEKRIYNNLKVKYNKDIFDIFDFVEGENRNVDIPKQNLDSVMITDFNKWLKTVGNSDYTDNSFISQGSSFTYNYSKSTSPTGKKLPGFWRAVYKQAFDTDRPHTHPWELLGFTKKPSWWETVYGPAPYTRDNLILWQDLEQGAVKEPGKPVRRLKKFVRPGLTTHIPVDEYGRLISPLQANYVRDFSFIVSSKTKFKFGDESPTETAWRRSSEYPFALLTAILLNRPAQVFGIGFDRSRIERDAVGNLVYSDTNKRLNNADVVFPKTKTNGTVNYTCGLVNYVSAFLTSNDTSSYTDYIDNVQNIKTQLAFKLGGYTDKSKLRLVLDSRTPLNQGNVFVPDENYDVFFASSSPQETVVYSGVIVEKTSTGYKVKGYDLENPVFKYFSYLVSNNDPSVNVGGISESFIEWAESSTYVTGKIVKYNGIYYRVNENHRTTDTFESKYYSRLADLPLVGGKSAIFRKAFEKTTSTLEYNTTFSDAQQVVDFLLGYGKYLESVGFKFEYVNRQYESIENWNLIAKEFLFWTTQNWSAGTVIALSPSANSLTFEREFYVVDNIFDSFYDYSILTANGTKLNDSLISITRDNGNEFNIAPKNTDDGIYFARLPLIQKEHAVLIDNTTVFNDTIYSPEPGYRQERIKVIGYRTDNWNGSLNIPGFIYDEAKVLEWNEWKDYSIGDLVKYKEFYYSARFSHTGKDTFDYNDWNKLTERPESTLKPNFDYRSAQFADFYDLDTDNFDSEQQRLAQHLIGYQKRQYLENIIQDDVSQYKFYQGMIQDKGTNNALTKLFDKLGSANQDSLNFYEEWAIRTGQYGAVDTFEEVEYQLDESQFRIEPQTVELVNTVDTTRTDLVYQYPRKDVYLSPADYTHTPFPVTYSSDEYSKTGGYVKLDQINFIAKTENDIFSLDINKIPIGRYVWVPQVKQSWDIKKHILVPISIIKLDRTDTGFTATFNKPVTFAVDDIIGIQNINDTVDGFYRIKSKTLNTCTFVTNTRLAETSIDLSDSTRGIVSQLDSRRFATLNDVNTTLKKYDVNENDKLWVDDNNSGKFEVFENEPVFAIQQEIVNPISPASDGNYGKSIATNGNNTTLAVGMPDDNHSGAVYIYNRLSETGPYTLLQKITSNTLNTQSISFATQANPVRVTTDGNHGFTTYQQVTFEDVLLGMTEINNNSYYINVIDDQNFDLYTDISLTTSVDGTGFTAWDVGDNASVYAGDLYDVGAKFGTSVAITNNGQYLFIGAPYATNVKTFYKGEFDPAATYQVNDIVSDRGTLWRAKVVVNGDGSSINSLTQDWESVNVIVNDITGEASGLQNQGVVHIYKKQSNGSFVESSVVTSPLPQDNESFGEAIKVATKTDETHRVFVKGSTENGRLYFLNNQLTDVDYFEYTRDRLYKGTFSELIQYITDEIVFYEGALYKALNNVLPGVWDVTDWEEVSTAIDYNGFVPSFSDVLTSDTDSSIASSTNIAGSFDVNSNGEVLILTNLLATGEHRVSVYRLVEGRYTHIENIDSPVDGDAFAALGAAISDDGRRIAVGSVLSDENGIDNGKVYVFRYNGTEFALDQELFSPEGKKNELFGYSLDFSYNKLAVLALNGDITSFVTFDGEETYFDNAATRFEDSITNTGQVYIFENVNDAMVYAEQMQYDRDISTAREPKILLSKNHLVVALPGVDYEGSAIGMVLDFRSNIGDTAWTSISNAVDFVEVNKLKGVFLYDKTTEDIVSYLDYIDPIQGKIAGTAEQALDYKLYYDPAVFSIGSTTTGSGNPWTADYVGKLWWDLSTVKWYNPYQGDTEYRANNWNKVIKGFSVDVYEWVESDYKPSDWDALSGTIEGESLNISGTSKYGDSSYSTKKVYNPVTGLFNTKYYFWVKDSVLLPENVSRTVSAKDVANLIEDPAGQGYRFVAFYGNDRFGLYNTKSLVKDRDTILHVEYITVEDAENNIHTEYQLLTEGLATSKPNSDVIQKWVDSLVGYDSNDNQLPDISVSVARRYGILNTPNQSMFVNKTEAMKQVIERVNGVLKDYLIVDDFDLSPLTQKDPTPSAYSRTWDTSVASENLLRFVGVAKIERAVLTPVIVDGKITEVTIVNPGRGYIDPIYAGTGSRLGPVVEITGTGTGAKLQTYINNLGQITSVEVVKQGKNYKDTTTLSVRRFTVLVENDSTIGGFWALYTYDPASQEWFRVDTQNYDTNLYWDYIDWYATGYDEYTNIDFLISESYQLAGLNDFIGSIVKIQNVGTGGWLLLKKVDNQLNVDYTVNYETIGRQNGTVEFSSLLYSNVTSGFDNQVYDAVLYDREPVQETRIILDTLENNIFVDDLEVEWNKLFFASVRYALSEQVNIDWIFKTSFVKAKHNVGQLEQRVTYKNDNLSNYQDYVHEVKPYSTKVREYISSYESVDPTQTSVTDFDLPPLYNTQQKKIITENIKVVDNKLTGVTVDTLTYPRKHWYDNLGFEITEMVVYDGGSGWTEAPVITVSGGGGPTITGRGRLIGDTINFVDIATSNVKYLSVPTVTINGSQTEDGTEARIIPVLGSSNTRSTHLTLKFDRTSGTVFITDLNPTANGYEQFTGDGGTNEFDLIWPMNLNTNLITISVDGVEQLTTDFVATNEVDNTKSYTRYRGKITFTDAPALNADIKVYYKKDVSMLDAADRITYFYNPTTGMIGNDLSQLMDGVDYDGVKMDSYGFGNTTGFDNAAFASTPFDTFDSAFEDEIITLDGSINVLELSAPLEPGVVYNIYKNNVRIDDPQWDGSSVTANPNALMPSLTGDGITTTIVLNDYDIAGDDGDVFVVRKSTSDGSFTPIATSYDVALQGGNFEYTTAKGIDAGEIVVDGDGFVTPTTSKGPEELVPGQILDTLDMSVYNRVNDGNGIITTHTYVTDGENVNFPINALPQSQNDVIVKIDDYILEPSQYIVNWTDGILEIVDSTMLDAGQKVYIVLIGSNGENIVDRDRFIADGNTIDFVTPTVYDDNFSAFVTINGVINTAFSLKENTDGFLVIELTSKPIAGTYIDYTIYNGRSQQYSTIEVDESFVANGSQVHYTFPELPLGKKPTATNILVRVDNNILTPGYNKKVVLTSARSYDIDRWQFEDYSTLRKSDFVIYIDGSVLDDNLYTYDTTNGRIVLSTARIGLPGQIMEMFVIRDADYYFVDTVVTITDASSLDLELNNRYTLTVGDSTSAEVLVTAIDGNDVTFCGYVREIEDVRRAGFEDNVVLDDSTTITIEEVSYVETNVLTFATPPANNADVKIYTFSNHDINQFERISLDVIVQATTTAPEYSDQYIDQRLLTDGVIRLRQPAVSAEYVWVIKDGVLLTANVDYSLNPDLASISLSGNLRQGQNIQVLQFAAPISRPKFGYRVFKDMLNRNHFKRLNKDNEYVLAENLNYYDLNIVLEDATGIAEPNRNIYQPGIIWIDGERIEYFIKDGNVLKQLRRGTLGTGIKTQHLKGSIVSGQGPEESIPYKEQTLSQVLIADGSTGAIEYTLDFDLWGAATEYYNKYQAKYDSLYSTLDGYDAADRVAIIARNFIDVYLGGRLLRKTSTQHFDPSVGLDTGDAGADYTVEADYRVDENNNIFIQPRNIATNEIISPSEYEGQQIKIVRRIGKVWNDDGKSLSDSDNQIARFIKDKTISLVR